MQTMRASTRYRRQGWCFIMLLLFGHVLFFSSTLVKAVAFNQQDAAEALAGMGNVNVQQPGQNLPGMNGFGPWFAGILGNQVEVDNLINLLFVCAVIISGLGYGLVQVIAHMAITGTYAGVVGMVTVACCFVLWHLIGHAPAHGENPPNNFQQLIYATFAMMIALCVGVGYMQQNSLDINAKTIELLADSVSKVVMPKWRAHNMPVVPPATSDGGGTCVDPPSDSEVDDDDVDDYEEEEVDFYADSSYDVVT